MKAKAGDKVRVIKDVRYCDTIKKGDIVEIDCVEHDHYYYVKGHEFIDEDEQYWLTVNEFELYEEEDKCEDVEDGRCKEEKEKVMVENTFKKIVLKNGSVVNIDADCKVFIVDGFEGINEAIKLCNDNNIKNKLIIKDEEIVFIT